MERHAAIRLRIGNQTHVNKSGDRVAISPAIGPAAARVTGRVVADFYPRVTAAGLELGLAIDLEARVTAEALELGLATGPGAADPEPRVTAEALELGPPTVLGAAQTESETGICHARRAEAETETPSVAAPEASTDRTRERTATAVLPAWDREAAVLEGVVEVADLAVVVVVAAAAVDGADKLRGPETRPEGALI